MKGIASTGAPKTLLGGWWMDGWVGGWVAGKARLRIAYSNQQFKISQTFTFVCIAIPKASKRPISSHF
jgi:hypothetical protein